MFCRIATCFFVVVIVTFLSSVASAVLVKVTDSSSPGGADNVTRDTATNLEWLDWTASTGISFNSMVTMFDVGDTYEGWGHATRDQVRDLMSNAGLPTYTSMSHGIVSNWPNQTNFGDPGIGPLLQYVGVTYHGLSIYGPIAITADPVPGQSSHYIAEAIAYDFGGPGPTYWHAANRSLHDGSNPLSLYGRDYGHALIRTAAIPEPTSFLYLSLVGLAVAGVSVWKKKRRSHQPDHS